MSRIAYWQSEALSRDLLAQAGSQSQLNVHQLVSCPSLLTAALVSDPAVVMVPLVSPPKRSPVSDWLQQQNYGRPMDSKHTAKGDTTSSKHKSRCQHPQPVDYGQPIDSKHPVKGDAVSNEHTESRSTAIDLMPVDYGRPVDYKHTAMTCKNSESVNRTLISMDNQLFETLRSEEQDFDVCVPKSDGDNYSSNSTSKTNGDGDDDDDDDEKKRKKSLLRRRQCRVSFLTDVGRDDINLVDLMTARGAEVHDDNDVKVDKSNDDDGGGGGVGSSGGGDGGGGDSRRLAEVGSPTSDSSSILLCSQPSFSGRHLPKASFIDLEVPQSWRERRQSQMSDTSRHSGSADFPPVSSITQQSATAQPVASTPTTRDSSRHSGSVDFPPLSATTSQAAAARLHVASTPTTSIESHQSKEAVNLSAISCSPITPRTTSYQAKRPQSLSPSVEVHKDHDDGDEVTVIPCSPLTPTTTLHQKDRTYQTETGTGVKGRDGDDDDDITVVPCTPVTPTSSQTAMNSSHDRRLSTRSEEQQDGEEEDEELTVVSCSPVAPTTTSKQVVHNRHQEDICKVSYVKVVLSSFYMLAVN